MMKLIGAAALLAGGISGIAQAQESNSSNLMAGAAKVDITPAVETLPAPLSAIHDPIFVRALVVESAGNRVIMAVAEVPAIAADIYSDLVGRISDEFGVPRDLVMLGTTHTHNSLRVAPPGPSPIPTSKAFTDAVIAGTMGAVRAAVADLQPARAGYDSGQVSLVAGRDEWHAPQHRYIDGIDRSGREAVDQTLGVYEFEALDGTPIGVILNYGIEPVVYEAVKSEISGDVPGAASRYVEEATGGEAVALFTIGSPATPAYRVWSEGETGRSPETIMNAMGVILGEEALARMERIEGSTATLPIAAAYEAFSCLGKQTTPRNLRTHCAYEEGSDLPACEFTDEPFQDVTLTMGVLRLGDVAYLTADGNAVPALWEKLKRSSPMTHTQFVGTNFGPFRFIVDDAAYALRTYPATDTRAAAGCAEEGFLKTAAGLFEQAR